MEFLEVFNEINSVNQKLELEWLDKFGVEIWIKREDLLHPYISGNKFRKLKYNILENLNSQGWVTFGGAYSNHILAVAYAGFLFQKPTIGIIRGEELQHVWQQNPTLIKAAKLGMQFRFISRELYQNKEAIPAFFPELKEYHWIPEGGTNTLAIKGCEEILTNNDSEFHMIACAVGTGGTIAGIIKSAKNYQKIIGFPALKGAFLAEDIRKFVTSENSWNLVNDYHFGGYGKVTSDLIQWLNEFYKQTKIPLDPLYTGKMMYGILDLVRQNYFERGTKILVIHTGGLQGIEGMNETLKNKNKTTITYA
ncbi:MAG: 1-aminocyclopropane-1-carboxylate deaminase/D-cysteine desulfhydrase [Flavobacterium sp.]